MNIRTRKGLQFVKLVHWARTHMSAVIIMVIVGAKNVAKGLTVSRKLALSTGLYSRQVDFRASFLEF